jgi:hypothetical protein
MGKARTTKKWPGNNKSSRHQNRLQHRQAIDHALILIDTVCLIAGSEDLIGDRNDEPTQQLRAAIANHDTALLFGWLMEALSFQGISNGVALGYMERHGRVTWDQIARVLGKKVYCPKLKSYWSFHRCGYEKGSETCAEPNNFSRCQLPRHDLRNGRLNQTAYSLFLFIRDVADGDLVGWIDNQLRRANRGTDHGRLFRMREALIGPLRHVYGVSDKVLSMALSDLLLAAPRTKRYWFETGASMIVIDTLVHNFLHRTGTLKQLNAQHAYGPACYRPGGCIEIIECVAARIDAQQYKATYPKSFPRFVQHAIWRFCGQEELDICNGNQIDDRKRCGNVSCPTFSMCERVALKPKAAPI